MLVHTSNRKFEYERSYFVADLPPHRPHAPYLPIYDRILGYTDQGGEFLDLHTGVHPGLPQSLSEIAWVDRVILVEYVFWYLSREEIDGLVQLEAW